MSELELEDGTKVRIQRYDYTGKGIERVENGTWLHFSEVRSALSALKLQNNAMQERIQYLESQINRSQNATSKKQNADG